MAMAIDGTYAISAEMGGKRKRGLAEVVSDGNTVWVSLDVPVVGKVSAQGMLGADGSFSASGSIRVLLKRISYTVEGRVDGEGVLTATAETSAGHVNVVGVRADD